MKDANIRSKAIDLMYWCWMMLYRYRESELSNKQGRVLDECLFGWDRIFDKWVCSLFWIFLSLALPVKNISLCLFHESSRWFIVKWVRLWKYIFNTVMLYVHTQTEATVIHVYLMLRYFRRKEIEQSICFL